MYKLKGTYTHRATAATGRTVLSHTLMGRGVSQAGHREESCEELLWLELCRLRTKVEELLFLLTLVSPGRAPRRKPEEQQRTRCTSSWKRWPVKSM